MKCANCQHIVGDSDEFCPNCDFPLKGCKSDKIAYNTRMMKMRDMLDEEEKSKNGIFSIALIFFFMAAVALAFSLIFSEDHFQAVMVYSVAGLLYFGLHRLGKKSAYLMASLALLFYLGHTIYEFSHGIYLYNPMAGAQGSNMLKLFFGVLSFLYLVFRLTLMVVLARYLLLQLKLRKHEKMADFLRSEQKGY